MKVSIDWLKQLVDLKVSTPELVRLLPLRTIGLKDVTDDYIELDMKGYNRADLLSLRGVAYEVAAITDSNIKFEDNLDSKDNLLLEHKNVPKLKMEILDEDLASVYCLVKIENLKVEQSSDAWKQKLLNSGYRSINNIADVTNLVMLEYGQPLHAFDAKEIKDETIIVRTAKKGERIVTLDNKTRLLKDYDLLITDPEKIVGIAGIMGGKNSEVSDSTTSILIEAAIFDPKSLRKTATRLGLQSEASKRFYHGLTKRRLFQALNAAIKMYKELGGKITGLSIKGTYSHSQKEIELTQTKVNSLIGIDIKPVDVERYLRKLHFEVSKISNSQPDSWLVKPPYFRLDIEIEEDVIEEIARMYGYEKIPAKPLVGEIPKRINQSQFILIHNLKLKLVELGLTEVQTYSFFSTPVLKNFGWMDNDNLNDLIKIANPISSETEYLRQNLWSNLIEAASLNLKYFGQVAIFEIGKVYTPQKGNSPKESLSLAILLVNKTNNPLAELNQIFDKIKGDLKLSAKPSSALGIAKTLFHPNRFLFINKDGKQIGGMAEVHQRLSDKFGIEKRAAILEIYLEN